MMNNRLTKEIFGAGVGAILGKVVTIVMSFVFFSSIGRSMEQEDLGVFLIVFNAIAICSVISQVGMNQVAVRTVNEVIGEQYNINSELLSGLIIAMTLSLPISVAAIYYLSTALDASFWVQISISGWLLLSVLQLYFVGMFRAVKATFWAAILTGGLTNLIFLTFFYFDNDNLDLANVILLYIISLSISVVIAVPVVYRKFRFFGRIKKITFTHPHLNAGFALMMVAAVNSINEQGDIIFLANYFSPEELSIYGLAQKIVRFVIFPLVLFNILLPPFIVQLYSRKELEKLQNLLRAVAAPAFAFCTLICIAIYLYPKFAMGLFFSGEISSEDVKIVLLFSVAQTVNVLTGFGVILLSMTAHQGLLLKVVLAMLVLKYFLFLVMPSEFGLFFFALVSAGLIVLQNILMWCMCWKILGINTLAEVRPTKYKEYFRKFYKRF